MAELRAAFRQALPIGVDDLPAMLFWFALGYAAGLLVAVPLEIFTSVTIQSFWFAAPLMVGGFLGLRVWWWARNAGT